MIDQSVYAFSPDNAPLKSVQPGEVLTFKTMDCFSNKIREEKDLVCDFDYSEANPAAPATAIAKPRRYIRSRITPSTTATQPTKMAEE